MSFIVSTAAPTISAPVITLTNLTTTTVTVNLTTPSTAPMPISFYSVQVINASTLINVESFSVQPSQFPFTITGLTSGVTYNITVTGVENTQNVYLSPQVLRQATTGSTSTAPGQVTGLILSQATSSSLTLNWTAPTGASTYTIERNGVVIVSGFSSTTYVDSGLLPSTNYSYMVAAVNAAGMGPYSTSTATTTLPTTPVTFGLKVAVVGGKGVFTDLSGNVLQLQGTSISGLETNFAPGRWPGFANTTISVWEQIIAAWSINIFRIYIDEWSWRTNPTQGSQTYRQIVQSTVQNMNAAGAYVICTLMWAAPSNVLSGKANGQPSMPNTGNVVGDCVGFWTSFAASSFIVNNAGVMLETFNEPFYDNTYGGSTSTAGLAALLNGGNFTPLYMQNNTVSGNPVQTFNVTYTIAGTQAMVTAIRNAGFNGVILYPKPWFSGEIEWDAQVRPIDPLKNLGSAQHQYGYNPGVSTAQAAFNAVLNAQIPVITTETYGVSAIGGYSFYQAHKIGYCMGPGPNNWGSAANLNKMITTAPWSGIAWGASSYNYDAWPPFGPGSG